MASAPKDELGPLGQFFWGLAGAVFPPLIRAYGTVKPDTVLSDLGSGFMVLSVCVFIGGGLWSIAMGADKPWKAMYYGATFPLVFGFLTHAAAPAEVPAAVPPH